MTAPSRARTLLRRASPALGAARTAQDGAQPALHAVLFEVCALFRAYGLEATHPEGKFDTFSYRHGPLTLHVRPTAWHLHTVKLTGLLSDIDPDGAARVVRKPVEVRITRLVWDKAELRWYGGEGADQGAVDAIVEGMAPLLKLDAAVPEAAAP